MLLAKREPTSFHIWSNKLMIAGPSPAAMSTSAWAVRERRLPGSAAATVCPSLTASSSVWATGPRATLAFLGPRLVIEAFLVLGFTPATATSMSRLSLDPPAGAVEAASGACGSGAPVPQSRSANWFLRSISDVANGNLLLDSIQYMHSGLIVQEWEAVELVPFPNGQADLIAEAELHTSDPAIDPTERLKTVLSEVKRAHEDLDRARFLADSLASGTPDDV